MEIFNRALSEAEIRSIFKAGPAGKIKPQPVEPPAGMVSWWPGDGHAMDIIDGNDGALQNGATFADGKVSHAFSLDGVDDFVLVPDSPNLNITGDVTVDLWAKRTSFGAISFLIAKGGGFIGGVDVPTAYLLGFNPSDELRASFELADGSGVDLTAQAVVDDAFHHYAYVRGGNTHELFIDGVLVTGGTFTGIPGDTSGLPLVIGGLRTDSDPTGFESHFVGLIDEIEIFNRALTADEIRAIFEAGSAGKVKPPPDPVEPPAGMVSWWPGDGNANDIIGVNDGVLSGDASFAPGKVGQAFSFDGTGDFVEVPHSANMNLAQFSVDTWVFIDPVVNAGQFNAFVGKSDGSTVGGGFWLAHDARNEAGFPVTEDALHFTVNGGPSGAFLKNSVPESGFYHLTGTFDGSQARLYINGSLVATGPAIPGIAFNTFPLRIGAINLKERTGIDDRFEGLIDEVELFNRALTEAEIWAIFKAGPAGKRKPQPVEPPAGMVSWWSADGHAMDIVDGNDGALQNGATFADGKVGHAFSLDGVDDRVVVPHSGDLNINGAVTLDAWIKPDSLACPGGWCAVVAKSDVSNVKRNYGLWVRSNGQLWLSYINTGGAERLLASAAGTITIGTFQHVAGVIDTVSGTMRVFKNGVEMGSAPASGAMAVNTEPLTIGFADPGIGNDFNGLIDEVEIFNRALSEAEIRSIFDSGREGKIKPPPGPLEPPAGMVSWWPGDGNALDIEDGNDGALSGDATFTGGMVGQAFRFDGTGDFVEIPDSANLDITESITVDAWINQRSRSPEVAPIVSKWNDIGVNNRSYHLVLQGSSLRWDVSRSGLFGPSQSATVFSSVGVPLHMWVHVAGTFDSATQVLRVYVNGVEVGSAVAPSSNIFPSNEPLLIGAGDIGSNVRDFFDGLIDEVELFDRALTEAEIWAIFNAGPAGKRKPQAIEPPAGMVSWWPGDWDTRDIIGDNDGTLSGDAIFAPGKVGQAFSFDGTGDFVLVPDSPDLNITGNVTVDLWAKRNGTGTGYLISKGAGAMRWTPKFGQVAKRESRS